MLFLRAAAGVASLLTLDGGPSRTTEYWGEPAFDVSGCRYDVVTGGIPHNTNAVVMFNGQASHASNVIERVRILSTAPDVALHRKHSA
jgi:hypothetical protein